jgi:hypothetical protein
MSSNSTIELKFADGEYLFALPLARITELERKCGLPGPPVGIGKIFARVLRGAAQNEKGETYLVPAVAEFFVVDLVETIRQGLIGGARGLVNGEDLIVTPALADRLIASYVQDRPLNEIWNIAVSILGACILGYDPPKKD